MKKARRGRGIRKHWWAGSVLIASFLLLGLVAERSAEQCQIAEEQGGIKFPVDRLDAASRCLIEPVVTGYTTSGLISPVQTPITQELYEYLLDRPVMMASLVQRLGLGTYQVTPRGQNRFWANDGEGTQGLFTLLYQDQINRIYHIDGYHEGQVFPMVRAKAVVFMRILSAMTQDGHPAVETALIAYTQLDDPILAGLVRILRPLIGEAVTRVLAKGFEVTNQLGSFIAQNPGRIVQEVASLSLIEPGELQTLTALLQAVSRNVSHLQPSSPTP